MTMKMKIHHTTYATILSILVLGCVMQKYTTLHAEEGENSRAIMPQQASGFKQFSNQELWEDYFAIVQFENKKAGRELTQNEIKNLREEYLWSTQGAYDRFLKMLIIPNDKIYSDGEWDRTALKQLGWVIETDKKSYKHGEPIFLRLSLKNISEDNVKLYKFLIAPNFVLNSLQVKRFLGKETKLVYISESSYLFHKHVGSESSTRPRPFQLLGPGDKAVVFSFPCVLNSFYDLSVSGEYELTFYTRNYLGDDEHQIGEYPKPCTIRFTIEGEYYEPTVEWSGVRSDVEK